LLVEEHSAEVIGFSRAFAPHDNGWSLVEVLIDPVMPLEQAIHDIGIFEVDIDRIDRTERFIFCNIRAECVEQCTFLLAALRAANKGHYTGKQKV
jgi:hypothetical protein